MHQMMKKKKIESEDFGEWKKILFELIRVVISH